MPVRVSHCPACRTERVCKLVGTARVQGDPKALILCPEPSCGLIWAVRPDHHQRTAA